MDGLAHNDFLFPTICSAVPWTNTRKKVCGLLHGLLDPTFGLFPSLSSVTFLPLVVVHIHGCNGNSAIIMMVLESGEA